MIDTQALRKKILDAAIRGKLTEQLPEDGNAEDLYKEIQAEKQRLIQEGKIKKDKSLPEITEEEIPFDIPESWRWIRLANIAIGENGDRSSKYPVESDYVRMGIPFFGSKDMTENSMSFNKIRYISLEKFNELGNGKLINNDIVCLLRGSVGKTALFKETAEFSTGFICAQMMIVRCLSESFVDYVFLCMKTPEFANQVREKTTGTAVRQLPAKDVLQMMIPLPPLPEQKRIVTKIESILSKLDLIEQEQKKLSDNSIALRNKLIQLGISGGLTKQLPEDGNAEDLYKEIQAEKQKLIKEGKIKKEKPLPEVTEDEIPFDIPENWKWVRLTDLGSFTGGNTPKSEDLVPNGGIPYFKVADMNRSTNQKMMTETDEYVSNSFKGKIFPSGSIVFPKNGGAVFTNKRRILAQDSVVDLNTGCFITHHLNCFDYVWKLFISLDFRKIAKGTALPTIGYSEMAKIVIPLPPLPEQKRIVEKLDQLLPLCDAMKAEISGGVGA